MTRFPSTRLKRADSRRTTGVKKLYLIFGLTDETYSLVTSTRAPAGIPESDYYLAITALNHLYWVIGCSLGALAGANLELDTTGMDFALTALFLVLVIEQWKQVRDPFPFVIPGLARDPLVFATCTANGSRLGGRNDGWVRV